jgi:cellulose synthase/poly-beta-1,6-N-acetylglucosamine synthase-like glycosyltransferase
MTPQLWALLFWGSMGALFYIYIGFPALLLALTTRRRPPASAPPQAPGSLPTFSIIIAAHNEEAAIARRLDNLLALDYPRQQIEIVVACDGCTDRTAEEAGKYAERGVREVAYRENRGKAAVHNSIVPGTRGAILLFTDAETTFAPDFLRVLAGYFADARNGCGSGILTLRASDDVGRAEHQYWEYETVIRYREHLLGILPFASGACLALRRELFQPIPLYSAEDNFLCYAVAAAGYRNFLAREAACWDWAVAGRTSHYRKRYRTALKSLQGALGCVPMLARGRRWGVLWALFSHRILRWLGGFLLPVILVANVALLLQGWEYRVALAAQLAFYAAAWLGGSLPAQSRGRAARAMVAAHSFVAANLAFCHAVVHTLAGKRMHQYRPASQA